MSTSGTPVSRYPRFLPVANVFTAQLNTVLGTLGAFIVTPAVLNGLGEARYGVWLLLNSFVSYMRLLEFGTSAGSMKYGSGAYERGDASDLARVFDTTAAIFILVGAATVLGSAGLVAILPALYPEMVVGQSGTIMALGAAVALDLVCRTYSAGLRTRSLFFVSDAIEIVTYSVFKLGLVLYLATLGLSFRVLALLTLAEAIARNALVVGTALKVCPFLRHVHPLRAERAMFGKLAAMGASMSVIQFADMLRFGVSSAIIAYFMPESPESIATFGIGTRLANIALNAIGVIGAVMIPRFSGLSERGATAGVADLLRKNTLATGLVASYLIVNLGVLGPPFLLLWLKKPFVVESGWILLMCLPAYYVAVLGGPAAGLLVGRGQLRGLTIITVLEGVTNLLVSVLLVGPLGIWGVAIGTVVPMLVVRGLVFPAVLGRTIGLAPSDFWRLNGRSIVIGAVYLLAIGGLALVPVTSYTRFVLLGLASTAIYLVILIAGVPAVRHAVWNWRNRLAGA